jgi:type III pantothenate kinase
LAIICVDVGNTFAKVALMEHSTVRSLAVIPVDDTVAVANQIRALPRAEGAIVSSVSTLATEVTEWLSEKTTFCMELSERTALPVRNLYRTPETLGKDRLAAVVGAYALFPKKNVLVMDTGTALTFDFLDSDGNYLGGNISPGLQMRFRALHEQTKKLPLLKYSSELSLNTIGNDTTTAITAGVQNGIIFEVQYYVKYFRQNNPEGVVVMTGGDINFFADNLKSIIFAEPNLVHIGLEQVALFNLFK